MERTLRASSFLFLSEYIGENVIVIIIINDNIQIMVNIKNMWDEKKTFTSTTWTCKHTRFERMYGRLCKNIHHDA